MNLSAEEKLRRKKERRQKKWEETHRIINGIDHKRCKICKEYYPSTEDYFHLNSSNGIDGLNPYCRDCTSKKSQSWNNNNKERFLISMNKYNNATEERKQKKRLASEKSRKKGLLKIWGMQLSG